MDPQQQEVVTPEPAKENLVKANDIGSTGGNAAAMTVETPVQAEQPAPAATPADCQAQS